MRNHLQYKRKVRAVLQPFLGIMRYLVTAEEMKIYDSNTIEKIGIPAMVLMERAALETFRILKQKGFVDKGKTAFLLVGCGNNGGDGLALARMFEEAGMQVSVCIVGNMQKATKQWSMQYEILQSCQICFCNKPVMSEYTVIVDALFGVGLTRPVQGEYAEILEMANRLSGFKTTLDIPSGINSNDGTVMGCAFQADLTVTYGFEKRGLYLYPGTLCCGDIQLADIGITEKAFMGIKPGMFLSTESVAELLPHRASYGNKGTFGKVLLIAGTVKMAGAALLAGKAAYRAGAGMVKILSDPDNRIILQSSLPEALFGTFEDLNGDTIAWGDVICFGPGCGRGESVLACLEKLIQWEQFYDEKMIFEKPFVIDADGLNLLSGQPQLIRKLAEDCRKGRKVIMTPHMGEFLRLWNCMDNGKIDMAELKKNAPEYAVKFADRIQGILVLKDARTYVCGTNYPVFLNTAGNSGMATAGSGDVLAGALSGVLAQGMDGFRAACSAVRLHALAGDRAACACGEHAVMAGDIVMELGKE